MRHAKYILAFMWLILPMVSCNYNRLDEPRSEEVGQQQWAATTHTTAQGTLSQRSYSDNRQRYHRSTGNER